MLLFCFGDHRFLDIRELLMTVILSFNIQ